MTTTATEKRLRKLSSKDLEKKVKSTTSSQEEKEVAKAIIKSRETGKPYVAPSFKNESSDFMKKNAEKQAGTEKPEKVAKKEIVKKDKVSVPRKSDPSKELTEEQKKKIQHIVLNFEGSKKELVVYLLEAGYTKQQLDKYTPPIAHWSYIYSISNDLGKK